MKGELLFHILEHDRFISTSTQKKIHTGKWDSGPHLPLEEKCWSGSWLMGMNICLHIHAWDCTWYHCNSGGIQRWNNSEPPSRSWKFKAQILEMNRKINCILFAVFINYTQTCKPTDAVASLMGSFGSTTSIKPILSKQQVTPGARSLNTCRLAVSIS